MSEVKLVYPASGLTAPSSWGSAVSIKNMVDKIDKDYGTYIEFVAKESNLPKKMITSFIAVESGGNPKAGASGTRACGSSSVKKKRDKRHVCENEQSSATSWAQVYF